MKTLSVAVNPTVMVGEEKYNYCGGQGGLAEEISFPSRPGRAHIKTTVIITIDLFII